MKRILVISDLHLPYQHQDAFNFLKEIKKEYKPDFVINIGDLLDFHAINMHTHDPDLYSAGMELDKSKEYIKELERMVEELRDQVNYKDEEWYWYWIPERLKYKLLSEDQARELEILKDENAQLKSKNMHYLKNIARWRKVARHLKEIILTLDYETNNTSHRKVRLNKTVGDT